MPLPVKLSEVVDELSCVSDDTNVYFNTKTGEFVVLTSEDMFGFDLEEFDEDGSAEDGLHEDEIDAQDLSKDGNDTQKLTEPEWMREIRQLRREVFESDDYIQLPDGFDLHDWQIMEEFCMLEQNCSI
jgi:hypothetical protein